MTDSCYLVVNRKGIVKMRANPPPMSAGQHAIKINVKVDDRYFESAIPVATLEIDESHLVKPEIKLSVNESYDYMVDKVNDALDVYFASDDGRATLASGGVPLLRGEPLTLNDQVDGAPIDVVADLYDRFCR